MKPTTETSSFIELAGTVAVESLDLLFSSPSPHIVRNLFGGAMRCCAEPEVTRVSAKQEKANSLSITSFVSILASNDMISSDVLAEGTKGVVAIRC